MPAFYYSSTAGEYTLVGAVSDSATLLTLNTVTGLPSATPFKVVLEPGQPAEEIIKVTAVAGASLTVVRGWDGTSATAHAAGAKVRHMMTAEDLTLSRAHEDATAAHGASGAVVGTTSAQTLTNKNLTSGTNTFPPSLVTTSGVQTVTNKNLASGSNTFPSSLATLTDEQTLTAKSMDGGANTFTNIPQAAVTGLPTVQTDVNGLKTDVAALKASAINSGSAVATAATGFNVALAQAKTVGGVCSIYLRGTRTGATIPGSGTGDINNTNVATLSDPKYFPALPQSGTTVADGQGIFFIIWTDGVISISALGPGADLASGAGWSLAATYLT